MSKLLFEESKELYDLCARTFDDVSETVGEHYPELQRETRPEKRFIFLTMGIVSNI
jgi:hypothetical protein